MLARTEAAALWSISLIVDDLLLFSSEDQTFRKFRTMADLSVFGSLGGFDSSAVMTFLLPPPLDKSLAHAPPGRLQTPAAPM